MGKNPIADFAQINSELALFDPQLAIKPQVVALNKIDLPDVQARWPEIEKQLIKLGVKAPLAISAVSGQDVRRLLGRAAEELQALPATETSELPLYTPDVDPGEFHVQREGDGWRLSGPALERAAAMTYWEHEQSVRRFQRLLHQLGVDKAMRTQGVRDGDTVYIGEYELEWKD
jgi:GTP-binding protein